MSEIPVNCPACGNRIIVEVIENSPVCVGGNTYEIFCRCGENAGTVVSKQIVRVTGGSCSLERPC